MDKNHSKRKIIKKWREIKHSKGFHVYFDEPDPVVADDCSEYEPPAVYDWNAVEREFILADEFRKRAILTIGYEEEITGRANCFLMKLRKKTLKPADIFSDYDDLQYLRDEFCLESVHTLAPGENGCVDRN